jgi:HEAT repeat protein
MVCRLCFGLWLVVAAVNSAQAAEETDWKTAEFDELMKAVQRFGDTDERRTRADAAKSEMIRRGTDTLRYLVTKLHLHNIQVRLVLNELRLKIEDDEVVVPVFLEGLDSDHDRTRRLCAFFLGKYDAPQHADQVLPFLNDPEVAGSAVRTLGKWKIQRAVPEIAPFLNDPKERRRILAVNALKEIGDRSVVPNLMHSLDDEYFSVREVASETLATMGRDAEDALQDAIDEAPTRRLRLIVKTLGAMESRRSMRKLRKLLRHDDPGVRGDTVRAVRRIDPKRSERWVADLRDDVPFVSTGLRESAIAP